MPAIRDPAAIRAILLSDPAWSVYALGDLARGFFEHCSWYVSSNTPPALALLYRGFTPPVLFGIGDPASIAGLLDELADEAAFYLQVRPEIVPVLSTRYRLTGLKPMWRMLLEPARFRHACGQAPVRLGPADLARAERLYADGHAAGEAPDFFFPSMLEDGVFFGIFEADELISIAGTHLVAPAEVVAAIGNVYTRRDRRRRGLGRFVTSAVVQDLLQRKIPVVALNVNQENRTALRIYENLGFTRYCEFVEGVAELPR